MNISTILPLALVVVSTCGQLALASSSPHPFGCEAKEGAEVNSDVREFSPLIIKSARATSVKDWQTRETAAITKNSGFVLNDVTKDDWIYVTLTAKNGTEYQITRSPMDDMSIAVFAPGKLQVTVTGLGFVGFSGNIDGHPAVVINCR